MLNSAPQVRHRRGDSIKELDFIEQRGLDGPIRAPRDEQDDDKDRPKVYKFHSRFTGETFGISGYGLIILSFGIITCLLALFAFRAVFNLIRLSSTQPRPA